MSDAIAALPDHNITNATAPDRIALKTVMPGRLSCLALLAGYVAAAAAGGISADHMPRDSVGVVPGLFFAIWYITPNVEKTLKLLKKIAQNIKKVFDKTDNI